MSLIKCKECGKQYYKYEKKCPNCGTPSTVGNIQAVGIAFILLGAIILGIVLSLLWCAK